MPKSLRLRPLAKALLAVPALDSRVAALALLLPLAAQVQAQDIDFNLPAQSLDSALQAFGKQANVQLLYNPDAAQGLRSNTVKGRMSTDTALQRLLNRTGMTYKLDGNTVTLAPDSTSATVLKKIKVTDRPLDATTENTRSYTSGAVTIGKGDQKLKDIPQSITVLTRQRMDDQNITSIPDVLNNVTGMTFSKSPGPGGFITARGFELGTLQYDGVPLTRNTYSLGSYTTDTTVFFDRVEVLRGAAGLLQGAGSAGGAVNFVRKRPTATPELTLTGRAGSWSRYGAQADIAGPINNDASLRGRFVADYQKGDSYIDYVWNWEQNLYGALDYDLTPDTTIGFGASHRKTHFRPLFIGLPRTGTNAESHDLGLPRSTFTGSDWNRALTEQNTLYADIQHNFNDAWTLKATAINIEESNEAVYQQTVGPVDANGDKLMYFDFATDFRTKNLGLDVYLSGKFELFGIKHETVIGGNYSKYKTDEKFARQTGPAVNNIFDIDHHRPWRDFDNIAGAAYSSFSNYDVTQKGIYGTWRAHLTDALALVLGGRSSWYENTWDSDSRWSPTDPLSNTRTESKASGRFTPYAGLVYAITPSWSAYASYSEVFIPQTERTVAGSPLKPIEGVNYELGIKGELADGRINTSFAVFRYEHENRAIKDIAAGTVCGGTYCSLASGKVLSEGFEAEISGEVLTGLQLFAGYAYNHNKFLEDIPNDPNNPLPSLKGMVYSNWTPKHSLRVWADYTLPGAWNKLSVGGGVNVQSHTWSNDYTKNGYNFDLAGFAIWSTRVAYQVSDSVNVAVNVNNLFDKVYYTPGYNAITGNNYYGDPRNLMFTVKYTPQF